MMDYYEYGLEWLGSIKDEKILLHVSARLSKWASLRGVSYRFHSLSTHQRQEQE